MALSEQTKHYLRKGVGSNDAGDEIASASDNVLVGQMNENVVKYVDVTLSSANILALFTTPQVLIAAPGAGKMILVEDVFATMVYNSTTYACNAAGASLFYKSDASGQAVGATITQGFIQSASGTNFQYVRGGTSAVTDVTANLANQPVAIKASTSDPTTGNSVIKIRVYYRVVPAPLA